MLIIDYNFNMTLEELNKKIKILEPKIQKWKWIVGIAASCALLVAGGILMLLSGMQNYNTTMLSMGIVLFGVGFIYLIVNICLLSKVSAYQKEYDDLLIQKKELELPSKEEKKTLLLKLLDEGKISKQEFDELIK